MTFGNELFLKNALPLTLAPNGIPALGLCVPRRMYIFGPTNPLFPFDIVIIEKLKMTNSKFRCGQHWSSRRVSCTDDHGRTLKVVLLSRFFFFFNRRH